MQQPDSRYDGLHQALAPLSRQIERLEERLETRTRDLVTRNDLTELRKEVVTRDLLQSELSALRTLAARNASDIAENKRDMNARFDEIEKQIMSKQEVLALRAGGVGTIAAFLLALFDFLAKSRLVP
jgi:hypothetical protein